MAEKFDSVVVGAGPAGIAAAYTMAKAGLNVLVLERGERPGAKNVFGGIIFRHHTEQVVPADAWKSAPIERRVIDHQYWFLSEKSHIAIGYRNQRLGEEGNSFTVHRAKFDPWLAKFAEDAGALFVNRTTVTGLLHNDGKIVGVETERGNVLADVVVAADGVNSLLAQKAGLHPEWPPESMVLAMKEVLALPRQKIEDRFNLRGDEGVAAMIVGQGLGMHAGFIYTNRDTISIGMGVALRDLKNGGRRPNDLLEDFKNHPSIKPLIEESELKEYSAHLIPEGGYDYIPPVHMDGLLVAGDAAMFVNVVGWEGTNLAITSGIFAGETIVEARKAGDYTSAGLSRYRQRLENSFIIQDLRKFRRVPRFFASNPHFFSTYPNLMNELGYLWHRVDADTKPVKIQKIKQTVWRTRSRLGLLKDAVALWRIFA
jgi:electron transfer flavoprotein-quinone oxidoreductase